MGIGKMQRKATDFVVIKSHLIDVTNICSPALPLRLQQPLRPLHQQPLQLLVQPPQLELAPPPLVMVQPQPPQVVIIFS